MIKHFMMIVLGLLTLSYFQIYSQEEKKAEEIKQADVKLDIHAEVKETFSETRHEVLINGQVIPYKAIVGNLILKDAKGTPSASVFFTSYTRENVNDIGSRPITFCFNGGPGSSSVWLHLGAFGPKRVRLTNEGEALPPYGLIDNEYSILDLTDLVFIDPISTGYSRAIPPEEDKKFHGYEEDIKSIGDFIRLYITRYNRWDSPKFLAGESYGSTRAVGLANYLHQQNYLYLNGIVLVSSVLNFQSILFDEGNDLPYVLFLPAYTATAWYHNKLPQDLQANFDKAMEEVSDFVTNEYSVALFKGDTLKPEEKKDVIEKLERYTGLSSEYIKNSDLRIDIMRYVKELMRNKNITVGRFDSRFVGTDTDIVGETFEYDPSADAIFGAFTATLNHYMHNDLKWEKDGDYKILTSLSQWDYSIATNQYLNVTDKLISVLIRNPHLRVFVANGYYDLATPFYGTEYTFNHLGLDQKFRNHISMKYYHAGHMMYIHQPSLVKLKTDLREFYKNTLETQ